MQLTVENFTSHRMRCLILSDAQPQSQGLWPGGPTLGRMCLYQLLHSKRRLTVDDAGRLQDPCGATAATAAVVRAAAGAAAACVSFKK